MKVCIALSLFGLLFGVVLCENVSPSTPEELYENGNSGGRSIEDLVDMIKLIGQEGLIEKFVSLRFYDPDQSTDIYFEPQNAPLNRYIYLPVYDYNRVILTREDDNLEAAGDFISANFVDGYKQKNKYIATPCPFAATAESFYEMIWEQNVLVITMLTNVVESGVVKGWQYWAVEEGDSMTFGNYEVTTQRVVVTTDYTVSTLRLHNSFTQETRIVSHWHHTSWPDQKTPASAESLLEFLQGVRDTQAEMAEDFGGPKKKHPIIVHCSAGIARTGTFISLDISIARLTQKRTVNFYSTIQRLRDQRAFAMGTPSQYVFAHRALIQYALDRNILVTDFDLNQLPGDAAADEAYSQKLIQAIGAFYQKLMSG